MRLIHAAFVASLFVSAVSENLQGAAQQPGTPPQAKPQTPPAPPGQPPPTPPPPGQAPPATAPPVARTFTAPVGLLFNSVRADRVADFEKVIAYLQAALAASTDPAVQAQARGWRIFRASEPGPNSTVLFAFVLDPVAEGADYSLGRILADAYPAQIQELWRLYTGSVTSGGSLLNLTPVKPVPPPLLTAPAQIPTTPAPQPAPPDADPAR